MMRRLWPLLALGGVLAVAGCSDDKDQTPTAPSFKPAPPPLPYACDFNQVKNLVTMFFSPPTQQTAQGYESKMETYLAQSDSAVFYGFKIMELIGQASRTATISLTTGSSLTKALTKCMFDAAAESYTSLSSNGIDGVLFENALDFANGGVYFVVGTDFTNSPDVLSGKLTGTRLSAVAPGPATVATDGSFTLGSWTSVLASNNTTELGKGKALVYGYPTSTNLATLEYELATIAPLVQFTPYALVSICDGSTDQSSMVRESNFGVLAFSTANLCGLPDATGTATGFRSKFSNKLVGTLNLTYNDAPPSPWKLSSQPFPVSVWVSVPDVGKTTIGVFGVCMYLTGTNNNGQLLDFTTDVGASHDPACITPPIDAPYLSVKTQASSVSQTLADFGKVSISKTGTLTLTVTADVIDRSGSGILVRKISVKP